LDGPLTTYQQQLHYRYNKKIYTCSRTTFLQDLIQEIKQWTEEGEEIIVLADMNKDLTAKDIRQFCKDMNLMEAIVVLHGQALVPTHQRASRQ